jgi:ABC-type multidrug transport system fused ATPase/permease subunit
METLKLIPQVFFDLFARVVPGCVGIISFLTLFRVNWQLLITYLFGPVFAQESTTLSFLIFIGAGFVVGELLSPAAKMVQRINEMKIPATIRKYRKLRKRCSRFFKILFNKRFRKEFIKLIHNKSLIKKTSKEYQKEKKYDERKLRYDRLRLEKPDVGALCAKIRGEFTMHNSLSVVFGINSLYYPFSTLTFNWHILALLLLLTFLTAYRGRTTNQTFNDTVAKFTQLLNEKNTSNTSKPIEATEK